MTQRFTCRDAVIRSDWRHSGHAPTLPAQPPPPARSTPHRQPVLFTAAARADRWKYNEARSAARQLYCAPSRGRLPTSIVKRRDWRATMFDHISLASASPSILGQLPHLDK
jgi:hypothetical protein